MRARLIAARALVAVAKILVAGLDGDEENERSESPVDDDEMLPPGFPAVARSHEALRMVRDGMTPRARIQAPTIPDAPLSGSLRGRMLKRSAT
jgi:hypothetical protein